MHLSGGRRVRPLDLIEAELLAEGDELVYRRRRAGETHHARIIGQGRIGLSDGGEFTTPSSAARAVAGSAIDGWTAWTVARSGELLDTVRQKFLDDVNQTSDGSHGESDTTDDDASSRLHAFLKAVREAAARNEPPEMTVRDLIVRWGSHRGRRGSMVPSRMILRITA